MITFDMLGPTPLTESSAAASALLTSTWANAKFGRRRQHGDCKHQFLDHLVFSVIVGMSGGRRRPDSLTVQHAGR
jgi:hypothetical protein